MDFVSTPVDCRAEIALVNPPFGAIFTPSIQLGLLKALCARDGLAVDDIYANVDFAQQLGIQLYNAVCWMIGPQVGEWLFGASAFGAEVPVDRYIERFRDLLTPMTRATGSSIPDLLYIRQTEIPRLVSRIAAELARYRVIGFSTTFQQNVAALAFARAIKAANPDAIIVFGGSNVHGVMGEELFRAFSFLDHVVVGEADHLVAPLFRSLLDGDRAVALDGVLSRRRRGPSGGPDRATASYPAYPGNLDSLPVPDYSSYFRTMRRAGLLDVDLGYPIAIPFESSRGCWWGAKNHCTFCGLNTVGMTFRPKSPARVVGEIETLRQTYGIHRFEATDNIISRDNDSALLTELAKLPHKPELFYEIKSNIGPRDAARLAAAGVLRVQPGVESFSTHVLKIMNKGVSGLHNINALRWLSTFGISPLYNILYGFPDEEPEDYEYQHQLVARIAHLPPPSSVGRIRLDRFSPNFERPELRAQFTDIKPAESYAYVYPDSVDLERAAYHFEGTALRAATADQLQSLFKAVDAWKVVWGQGRAVVLPFQPPPATRPRLDYRRTDGEFIVLDGRRTPATPELIRLAPPAASLLEAMLFRPVPLHDVIHKLASSGPRGERLLQDLAELQDRGLVLIENKLGLALPLVDADDELVRDQLREPPAAARPRFALPMV
jgi:ribosomal peptide maturation radical SAM protein 1